MKRKKKNSDSPDSYNVEAATLLDTRAGFYEDNAEPMTCITVGHVDGEVVKLGLSIQDSRKLVLGLLCSLDILDDCFANHLLEGMIHRDNKGNPKWPEKPADFM